MPVRVVTDSSCDLPQALADDLGIVIVPLIVRFGADERLDRHELTPTEFWARRAVSRTTGDGGAPAEQLRVDLPPFPMPAPTASSSWPSPPCCPGRCRARSWPRQPCSVSSRSPSSTPARSRAAWAWRRSPPPSGRERAARSSRSRAAAQVANRTEVLVALEPSDHARRLGGMGLADGRGRGRSVFELATRALRTGRALPRPSRCALRLLDRVTAAGPLDDLVVFQAEAADLDGFVSRVARSPGPLRVDTVGAVLGSRCGPGAIGVAYQERSP